MAFSCSHCSLVFFFNDTATTEIYTLSLHDALPILRHAVGPNEVGTGVDIKDAALCSLINFLPGGRGSREGIHRDGLQISDRDQILERVRDRKSTRLNSSHLVISYAVFCLKKKKKITSTRNQRQRTDD